MAVALNRCIFDPMLVKPKCIRELVVFRKIVNKPLKNLNKLSKTEKTTASQAHFGFTNMGPNMNHFSATAIYF